MKRILAFLCAALVLPVFAEPAEAPAMKVKHVDAKAAAKLLASEDKAKKPIILDVRTPREFKMGHLKGATNISFTGEDFEAGVAKLDKEKPYLVHCRSGSRSTSSLEVFKKLGFKNIIHLDGGYVAWQDAKLETVK